jgi:hypothetical protein
MLSESICESQIGQHPVAGMESEGDII